MDRHFYHSFPRIRPNYEHNKIIQDGIEILKSIKQSGLILAPEVVEWKQSLIDGKFRTITNRQVRVSFTELDSNELCNHSKIFGPFSLEFDIVALRKLGALPVIYMPQHLEDGRNLSSVGASIVTQTTVKIFNQSVTTIRKLFRYKLYKTILSRCSIYITRCRI